MRGFGLRRLRALGCAVGVAFGVLAPASVAGAASFRYEIGGEWSLLHGRVPAELTPGFLSWMQGELHGWVEISGELVPGAVVQVVALDLAGIFAHPLGCNLYGICLETSYWPGRVTLDPQASSFISLREVDGVLRTSGALGLVVSALGHSVVGTLTIGEASMLLYAFRDGNFWPFSNLVSRGRIALDGPIVFPVDPPFSVSGLDAMRIEGTAVPEPGTGTLLLSGLALLLCGGRADRRRSITAPKRHCGALVDSTAS